MDRPYLEEIEQSGSENSGILCDRRCRYHKKKEESSWKKKLCCKSMLFSSAGCWCCCDVWPQSATHTLRSLFLYLSAHQVFAFCDVSASNPKLSDPLWIPTQSSQCSGSDHTVLIRIRSGWTLPDDILARRWSTSRSTHTHSLPLSSISHFSVPSFLLPNTHTLLLQVQSLWVFFFRPTFPLSFDIKKNPEVIRTGREKENLF